MPGPLHGVRVIEMAGLGPTPFCAMMLADAGADVVTINRPNAKPSGNTRNPATDALARGRRHLTLDLKKPEATQLLLRLVEGAQVLLEGYRPGVMERLGLGPDTCLARNPRLVYGRMTGWGQTGPFAQAAGHDINYIALSGALHATGTSGQPLPPLNLVGDFGGGAMMLAFGVSSALYESQRSGQGQVIDAAMSDGAALLMAPFYAMFASGSWRDARESNTLDGAAPFYCSYRCSDGRFISVAPLEPQFYELFLNLMEISDEIFRQRDDRSAWPLLKERLAQRFASRTRDEWCALLEGTDVCFAPVLGLAEAPLHPHNRARGTFVDVAGAWQPAPAPRFSRTASALPAAPRASSEAANEVLREAGLDHAAVEALRAAGALQM
ncbi:MULTISPECIES: CaiB/BaiF CoA transferase family protein [Polaromonas]|uniref:CaiB/BaiF CoA transferase family protein n=1 Tax=Polaromonas aquatica TaxID=332657 RepID=A0ABW1U2J8_9BURK